MVTHSGAPQWTFGFVSSLAYMVILTNAVAWLLWLYALRTLSAGPAGLSTLAIPVVGVVTAWLQLGERPTAVEAVGMALIVGGLAVLAAHSMAAGRRALPVLNL
jgi:drug/metabolite transporter (DMT)-like permease